MHRLQPGLGLEQFHADMGHRAHAGRAIAPAVAAGTGRRQKLLRCGTRCLGRGRECKGRRADEADGSQVFQRVVSHLGIEDARNRHVAVDHHADGVAVGGAGHRLGSNVAPGAHLVLHHHRLAQGLGQRFGQGSRDQVGRGAPRKADDDLQGFAGPARGGGLGEGAAAEGGEGENEGGTAKRACGHGVSSERAVPPQERRHRKRKSAQPGGCALLIIASAVRWARRRVESLRRIRPATSSSFSWPPPRSGECARRSRRTRPPVRAASFRPSHRRSP